FGNAVALVQESRPDTSSSPKLRGLLEDVGTCRKKEEQRVCCCIYIHTTGCRLVQIRDPICCCDRHFVDGSSACIGDVVATELDRLPMREFGREIFNYVDCESKTRARWEDEGAARGVLLKRVVLDYEPEAVRIDAEFFKCNEDERGEDGAD